MPTAIVTGSSGGIGVALCRVLSAAGYHVIGLDRKRAPGDTGHFVEVDIGDFHSAPERTEAVLEQILDLGDGRCDLLVNNAAHQVVRPVDEITPEDWDRTLLTNLTAPFRLVQLFLPLLEASRGSVVNIASIHATATKPGFVAYATSKAALVGLTRSLAVELGPRGVRVNAVLPAATDTPMLRAGFERSPDGLRQLASMHPLQRIATPGEVAEAVRWLASESAGFITGATLGIDGGIGGRLHDPV